MAVTIDQELDNPAYSKNIVAYEVSTSLSKPVKARIFIETAPYSTVFDFVTELKAFPDENDKCRFYLEGLMDDDLLEYDKPDVLKSYDLVANVCRRVKASFYESADDDLQLLDQVYQNSGSGQTLPIISLVNGTNYIIIAEGDPFFAPTFNENGGSSKAATLLYEVGDEKWYSLSASADYNQIVAESGAKYYIYQGSAPSLVESGIGTVLLAGNSRQGFGFIEATIAEDTQPFQFGGQQIKYI